MGAASLSEKIKEDMKEAMRSKDKNRLGTIRLLMAAIKQKEVDERVVVGDSDILGLITKMIKQRQDAMAQYKEASRDDLAQKEQEEVEVLELYLPSPLSAEEVAGIVKNAIASTGANSMRDMGKVMAAIKPQIEGRADVAAVSQQVKDKLG